MEDMVFARDGDALMVRMDVVFNALGSEGLLHFVA
jgi:hypothetical protein